MKAALLDAIVGQLKAIGVSAQFCRSEIRILKLPEFVEWYEIDKEPSFLVPVAFDPNAEEPMYNIKRATLERVAQDRYEYHYPDRMDARYWLRIQKIKQRSCPY